MDDNKKFGDVSQEDIDKAKKAAPDDLKEKQPVNVMDEVFELSLIHISEPTRRS